MSMRRRSSVAAGLLVFIFAIASAIAEDASLAVPWPVQWDGASWRLCFNPTHGAILEWQHGYANASQLTWHNATTGAPLSDVEAAMSCPDASTCHWRGSLVNDAVCLVPRDANATATWILLFHKNVTMASPNVQVDTWSARNANWTRLHRATLPILQKSVLTREHGAARDTATPEASHGGVGWTAALALSPVPAIALVVVLKLRQRLHRMRYHHSRTARQFETDQATHSILSASAHAQHQEQELDAVMDVIVKQRRAPLPILSDSTT